MVGAVTPFKIAVPGRPVLDPGEPGEADHAPKRRSCPAARRPPPAAPRATSAATG
ncbi:hypothetical protein ACFQZ4_13380 [Catellatospora coxensis]